MLYPSFSYTIVVNRMENKITITYPRTEYLPLNRNIGRYIGSLLEEFVEYGETPIQPNFSYALNSTYEKEEYHEYLSFVIFSSFDIGGAHPDHRIYTVTYNTKRNCLVDIDDLIRKNPDLLNILSLESRKLLKKQEYFQKDYDQEMFLMGTEKTPENFHYFVFSENGLVIYFPRYQIAPYYAGEFQVVIPYSKLGIV